MAALLDTNVLLALASDRHPHSSAAAHWLDAASERYAVVCRVSQLGLMRLLNNPAVMRDGVLDTAGCWVVWRTLLSDSRIRFDVAEPSGLSNAFERFTQNHIFSPKLWNDAYLAAYAQAGGHTIATFDKGFRTFRGLKIELLQSD